MKVFVYFNLHKRCFSVKALEGQAKGLVIALWMWCSLTLCSRSRRQAKGPARTEKECSRRGCRYWDPAQYKPARTVELWATGGREVTYNPYKYEQFVYKTTETPVDNQPRYAGLHSDGQRATMWALK
jgi:hypothetical protein